MFFNVLERIMLVVESLVQALNLKALTTHGLLGLEVNKLPHKFEKRSSIMQV